MQFPLACSICARLCVCVCVCVCVCPYTDGQLHLSTLITHRLSVTVIYEWMCCRLLRLTFLIHPQKPEGKLKASKNFVIVEATVEFK